MIKVPNVQLQSNPVFVFDPHHPSMIETAAPWLHDAILLGASIAGVYLVVALLQLAQIRRRMPAVPVAKEPSVGLRHPVAQERPSTRIDEDGEASFALHLRRSTVEADIQKLRMEVQGLRDEMACAYEKIDAIGALRQAQTGMPLYNEAISMARRGMSVDTIASRCSISKGEAELVFALAQNPRHGEENQQIANKVPNERHPVR